MTVMTGEIFADICRQLWGHDWKARAAARLERSERQLRNIETGKSNVSRKLRGELLQVVREQIKVLSGYEREISD